jgi:hypothetical protein
MDQVTEVSRSTQSTSAAVRLLPRKAMYHRGRARHAT